ncbi:MAG: tetratricopeptide repeat protein [Bacteroidales bacterium]|nr:tetratricopeptide repeat protein [Bacteroidales bacterium]
MHSKATHWILLILTGVLFLMAGNVRAQNTLLDSTLIQAEELRNEKRLEEAAKVLAHYEQLFAGNPTIERLYGQTLCQLKKIEQAKNLYQNALRLNPSNSGLIHDYAQLLLNLKDYKTAEKILRELKKSDFTTLFLLGKASYYAGHEKKALYFLKKALELKPDNNNAQNLYREVHQIVSPKLQIAGSFRSDSQPLKGYGTHAVFQYYISKLLNLSLYGGINHYSGTSNSNNITYFKIREAFESFKGTTQMSLTLGKLYSGGNKRSDWSGDFQIKQALFKSLYLKGGAVRHNYDYTLAGVLSLLMYHTYSLELSIGSIEKWNGLIGSSLDIFPDNNSIITYFVSFQSKPVKLNPFSIAFGYAFNYMNSKEDRFGSVLSATELLDMALPPNTVTPIQGTYGSYYTPLQQFSNSLTTSISYQSGAITVNGNISVGIYAETNAPLLSLSTQYDGFRILKKYQLKNFVPINLGTSFLSRLGSQWNMEVNYTFTRTYFYDSHNLVLRLKYSF